MTNPFQIPIDIIDGIKRDVGRAVETAILRQNVAVALSRLKDVDANRVATYQQMQAIMGE